MSELQLKNSGKIEKYNLPKTCCNHEFCGTHASYFINVEYKGFPIDLIFCKKHSEEFDALLFQSKEG